MKNSLFLIGLGTLISCGAFAGAAPACDEVARAILATNAAHKIEDNSVAADFQLIKSSEVGDAGTTVVTLDYKDPSDQAVFELVLFGEGCSIKSINLVVGQ